MRLPSVLALLAGALCISAQTLDLRSYRDETYAVKATLGTATKDTPTQELYLSVDAFGSEVVVAGVDCWQCCAKTRYDASLSKATCTALPDAPDGTKADACTDAIQGGTISNGAASIIEATSVPPGSPFLSLPSDGVLGLSADVHGFYFARTCSNDVQKGGTVTLNAWDTTNCATVAPATPTTLTLTPSTDPFKVLSTALTKYNVDADVPAPTGGWLATFNTVSPNVTIPKVEFDKLNGKYWKAQADNTFDCNTLKSIPAATTIKLTFSPAGTPPVAPTLSFDIQQLVFQTDDGKCALRLNAQTEDAKQSYWEFGLPLFRTYCSLVDVKNTAKTIKFAVPKVAANAACTYSKLTVLPACNAPQTTTTTTTTQTAPTVSPNATQSPSQTTTPKGASRGQVMSVFSVFILFALSALF